MMAVGEGINARNTNELNRQVTRQAMATILRRGIRATVSSGIPLHPAASTVIRAVGQLPWRGSTGTAGAERDQLRYRENHAPVLTGKAPDIARSLSADLRADRRVTT